MDARDDARLTDRERLALANLEARAAAEDRRFANRLTGSSRFGVIARLPRIPVRLRNGWSAGLVVVAGLVLVVVSLATAWAVGVAGAVIAACGLWMVTGAVHRRWGARVRPGEHRPPL
jgi:Protein of unknown function (DUF3040)